MSEIARNAHGYAGGGRAEFSVDGPPQQLVVRVRDRGPGIAELDAVLGGRFRSVSGMGVGLRGSRRLMDDLTVETAPGAGSVVIMSKRLPRSEPIGPAQVNELARRLSEEQPADSLAEFRLQNRELLRSLEDLRALQEETARLNAELEETNRGVVTLYAELDGKALELQTLNAGLEERVATAVAEREHAEDSLRQAQKMEAVGQLTGGIAHDFNNLLQIVTGNLEILGRHLPPEAARARRAADNAMQGAQRAATLTGRLLAFSRRQPLAPKALDPNALITGMSDLLRRTLGEHVEIDTALAPEPWCVVVDPKPAGERAAEPGGQRARRHERGRQAHACDRQRRTRRGLCGAERGGLARRLCRDLRGRHGHGHS